MVLLGVYGTLKKGFKNSHILWDSERKPDMVLEGVDMFMVPGVGYSFPALVDGTGTATLEVYNVTQGVFDAVAHLEGPLYYPREINGVTFYVWAHNTTGLKKIEGWDESDYQKKKRIKL